MKIMGAKNVADFRRDLSLVALALAGCQLIVALAVALLPPPTSSEGGPLAGLFYAAYYAIPLALVGLGLRSTSRWVIGLVGVLALALVVLHSAPLLTLQLPGQDLHWQRFLGLVLSALSGLVEATAFVVAVAALLGSRSGSRVHRHERTFVP